MANEKSIKEAKRWLETACEDLEIAQILFENKKFPSACFHAQQSGEKVLKSLCYYYEKDAWGHSLVKLLDELRDVGALYEKLFALRKYAMVLDRFYIPTRYPDGLPDITPMDAFCDSDAQIAIQSAKNFISVAEVAFK